MSSGQKNKAVFISFKEVKEKELLLSHITKVEKKLSFSGLIADVTNSFMTKVLLEIRSKEFQESASFSDFFKILSTFLLSISTLFLSYALQFAELSNISYLKSFIEKLLKAIARKSNSGKSTSDSTVVFSKQCFRRHFDDLLTSRNIDLAISLDEEFNSGFDDYVQRVYEKLKSSDADEWNNTVSDLVHFYQSAISRITKGIKADLRSFWKCIGQFRRNLRTIYRRIIQFLFKNLDDESGDDAHVNRVYPNVALAFSNSKQKLIWSTYKNYMIK